MQSTAAAMQVEISEFLSWAEIRARHPNEWVVLVETAHGPDGIAGARVYGHSPDRATHLAIARAAVIEQRCPTSRWTGEAREPRWTWIRVPLPD